MSVLEENNRLSATETPLSVPFVCLRQGRALLNSFGAVLLLRLLATTHARTCVLRDSPATDLPRLTPGGPSHLVFAGGPTHLGLFAVRTC